MKIVVGTKVSIRDKRRDDDEPVICGTVEKIEERGAIYLHLDTGYSVIFVLLTNVTS